MMDMACNRVCTAFNRYRFICGLVAFSVLFSFVVLDRWAFTDLGFASFGRVWQLYISYADVGFTRRALIGTVFSETGINRLLGNEYVFAIAMHHVWIVLLAFLLVRFVLKSGINDRWLIASIFLSPAMIIQSGYAGGSLDVYVLVFVALNLLYVRSLLLFSLILTLGMLTHELFIFTIPAQFVALILRRGTMQGGWHSFWPLLLPVSVVAATLIVLIVAGQSTLAHLQFDEIMATKLPHAAYQHGLWSGYFEVGAGVQANIQPMATMADELGGNLGYIALPVLYLLLVSGRLLMAARGRGLKLLVLFTAMMPLGAYVVATDFYRWVGMAANMVLLLSLVLAALDTRRFPPWLNYAIVGFVLMAPLGSASIARPFPMHQFVLEKLR